MTTAVAAVVFGVGAVADAGPMTLWMPLALLAIVLTWGWIRLRSRARD